MGHWLLDVEVRIHRNLDVDQLATLSAAIDQRLGTTGAAATYNELTHDLLISFWLAADGAADAMASGKAVIEDAADTIQLRLHEWLSAGPSRSHQTRSTSRFSGRSRYASRWAISIRLPNGSRHVKRSRPTSWVPSRVATPCDSRR